MFSPAENQETLGTSFSEKQFSAFFSTSSSIPVRIEEGILLTLLILTQKRNYFPDHYGLY